VDDVAAHLAEHAEDDVCRFVTRGRRSDRLHDIEIWFGVRGAEVVLIAGNGPTSDWYRNLLTEPAVALRIGERWLDGRARAVTSGTSRRDAGDVMGAKYGWWGGDPDIGLTIDAWTWEVPAVWIGELRFRET
jgi:hypothetical protein